MLDRYHRWNTNCTFCCHVKVLRVPGFTKGRVKLRAKENSAHSLSGGGIDNVSFCCGGFVAGGGGRGASVFAGAEQQ